MSLAEVVEVNGIRRRLEHLGSQRGSLYLSTTWPPGATSCVIVCSSVFSDFTSNYHRERLLARTLATNGHGVIRFHYAGEGNSEGDRRDMTFLSLCQDASAVLHHASALGFSKFALLGTRLGALVAAATVASMPLVPLALWEPVADSHSFISEAQRARRISRTARGLGSEASGWTDELVRDGVLDVLGYDLHQSFLDSLKSVDLLNIVGTRPRPIFIARFRERSRRMNELDETLRSRKFLVESLTFNVSESWWFHDQHAPRSGDLLTATSLWLNANFKNDSR